MRTNPPKHTARGRRLGAAALVATLVVSGVVSLTSAPGAQAATRKSALASALALTKGYTVGIAVLDTKTGQFYGAGKYDRTTYATESVVKVFIATRLLVTGQMHGTTSARAYKMITQSDDAIASSLYGRVGGDGLINWVKSYFHEPDLGSPPSRSNWWGNTHIRAKALVHLYAKLKANKKVGPWLLNAMHHGTHYGSDGQYQFFGIPSASHGAAFKQGWGTDYDDWSFSADFNTTGFVDHDRYAVAILARGPLGTYGSKISSMLTAVARKLLPHGTFPSPAPTFRVVSSHSGRTAGGTRVTVYGTEFSGVQHVYFGRTPATSVRVISPWRLQATAPGHAYGVVNIRVVTDHGTTPVVSRDRFTYVRAPIVTGLSSASSPTAGGKTIVVHGRDFTHVGRVLFGSTAGTSVQVLSPWRLQVRVPAHRAGAVPVRVTTSYGTSRPVTAGQFTYVAAPTITTVSPASGPAAGGQTVTVTGTGLDKTTSVSFGSVKGTGVTVSAGTLTVTAPAHAAGPVDVQVTTPYGSSALNPADRYTYSG